MKTRHTNSRVLLCTTVILFSACRTENDLQRAGTHSVYLRSESRSASAISCEAEREGWVNATSCTGSYAYTRRRARLSVASRASSCLVEDSFSSWINRAQELGIVTNQRDGDLRVPIFSSPPTFEVAPERVYALNVVNGCGGTPLSKILVSFVPPDETVISPLNGPFIYHPHNPGNERCNGIPALLWGTADDFEIVRNQVCNQSAAHVASTMSLWWRTPGRTVSEGSRKTTCTFGYHSAGTLTQDSLLGCSESDTAAAFDLSVEDAAGATVVIAPQSYTRETILARDVISDPDSLHCLTCDGTHGEALVDCLWTGYTVLTGSARQGVDYGSAATLRLIVSRLKNIMEGSGTDAVAGDGAEGGLEPSGVDLAERLLSVSKPSMSAEELVVNLYGSHRASTSACNDAATIPLEQADLEACVGWRESWRWRVCQVAATTRHDILREAAYAVCKAMPIVETDECERTRQSRTNALVVTYRNGQAGFQAQLRAARPSGCCDPRLSTCDDNDALCEPTAKLLKKRLEHLRNMRDVATDEASALDASARFWRDVLTAYVGTPPTGEYVDTVDATEVSEDDLTARRSEVSDAAENLPDERDVSRALATIDVLTTVFPGECDEGPAIAGNSMLSVLSDAMSNIEEQLDARAAYHDFACSIVDCTGGTAQARFWRALSLLDAHSGDGRLQDFLDDETTDLGAWELPFSRLAGCGSFVEDALKAALLQMASEDELKDRGILAPDSGSYVTGTIGRIHEGIQPRLHALGGLVARATTRWRSFDKTGVLESADLGLIRASAVSSVYQQVQTEAETKRGTLRDALYNYYDRLDAYWNSGFQQASAELAYTREENQLNTTRATIDDLLDERRGLASHMDSRDLVGELELAIDRSDDSIPPFIQAQTTRKLILSGKSGRFERFRNYVDQVAVMPADDEGTPNELDDTTPIRMHLGKGSLLRFAVTADAWSPSCAIWNSNQRPFLDTDPIADSSGYKAVWSGSEFETTQDSDYHGHDVRAGVRVEACAGASTGSARPGPTASVNACGYIDASVNKGHRHSETSGTEARFSSNFTGGLFLDNTPFPTAPAGALLLLEVPSSDVHRRKCGASAAVLPLACVSDVRVIRHNTSYVAPQDVDVFFAINDRAAVDDGCANATKEYGAGQKLAVDLQVFVDAKHAARGMLARIADALAVIRAERKKMLSADTYPVPGDIDAVRQSALLVLYANAPQGAGDGAKITGDSFPPPILQVVSTFVAKEIADLERAVRIIDIDRKLNRHYLDETSTVQLMDKMQQDGGYSEYAREIADFRYELVSRHATALDERARSYVDYVRNDLLQLLPMHIAPRTPLCDVLTEDGRLIIENTSDFGIAINSSPVTSLADLAWWTYQVGARVRDTLGTIGSYMTDHSGVVQRVVAVSYRNPYTSRIPENDGDFDSLVWFGEGYGTIGFYSETENGPKHWCNTAAEACLVELDDDGECSVPCEPAAAQLWAYAQADSRECERDPDLVACQDPGDMGMCVPNDKEPWCVPVDVPGYRGHGGRPDPTRSLCEARWGHRGCRRIWSETQAADPGRAKAVWDAVYALGSDGTSAAHVEFVVAPEDLFAHSGTYGFRCNEGAYPVLKDIALVALSSKLSSDEDILEAEADRHQWVLTPRGVARRLFAGSTQAHPVNRAIPFFNATALKNAVDNDFMPRVAWREADPGERGGPRGYSALATHRVTLRGDYRDYVSDDTSELVLLMNVELQEFGDASHLASCRVAP